MGEAVWRRAQSHRSNDADVHACLRRIFRSFLSKSEAKAEGEAKVEAEPSTKGRGNGAGCGTVGRSARPRRPARNIVNRRQCAVYHALFDVPFDFSGDDRQRGRRPPISWEREQHLARQALAAPAGHVAMVVGWCHLDGVEMAIKELKRGNAAE